MRIIDDKAAWTGQATANKKAAVPIVLLLLILITASFLRLYNLRNNPGWYSDEGSDINIAANLLHGRLQYFAIGESPMIAARPLLFHTVLAGAFAVWGEDISTLRALTAASGVLSTLLLFLLARRLADQGTALLAAALFAIYPSAVLYSRFGFTYNLITPLLLAFGYCLYRYPDRLKIRWLIGAGLISGVAIITNPIAIVLPMMLFLTVGIYRWQHLPWVLGAGLLPGAYGGLMWCLSGEAFSYDLAYTLSRFAISLPLQVIGVVFHYERLWHWDIWFLPGIIGLFMISKRRARLLALGILFLILFSVARVTTLDGLGFYRLVSVLPLIALGVATFLVRGVPWALRVVQQDVEALFRRLGWHPGSRHFQGLRPRALALTVTLILFLTLLSPLLVTAILDVNMALTRFPTRFDWAIAQEPLDAQRTIDYLNAHADPDDVILASPYLVWALDSPAADFQQALAYEGVETTHLPGDIPHRRFQFDCSYTNARYVVLDELWRSWASDTMPEVAAMVSAVETWPIETRIGEFEIYHNPERDLGSR